MYFYILFHAVFQKLQKQRILKEAPNINVKAYEIHHSKINHIQIKIKYTGKTTNQKLNAKPISLIQKNTIS